MVISSPAACSERIAASRPAPGPLTSTSVDFMPCSIALRAAASAAICAANGVDFLEPLKPRLPAEAHDTTFPWGSLIVTMVLLKEAWTRATPDWTFLTSRFLRDLVCFLAANDNSDEPAPGRGRFFLPRTTGCRRLDPWREPPASNLIFQHPAIVLGSAWRPREWWAPRS